MRSVMVMDGSRRSTKANAFFTGFGRNKRIALFDTLIAQHGTPELVAVIAHEVGHYKKRHVLQGLVLSVVHTGVLFFLLSQFLTQEGLFEAFGVEPSVYAGLVFFGLLLTVGGNGALGGTPGPLAPARAAGRRFRGRDDRRPGSDGDGPRHAGEERPSPI